MKGKPQPCNINTSIFIFYFFKSSKDSLALLAVTENSLKYVSRVTLLLWLTALHGIQHLNLSAYIVCQKCRKGWLERIVWSLSLEEFGCYHNSCVLSLAVMREVL